MTASSVFRPTCKEETEKTNSKKERKEIDKETRLLKAQERQVVVDAIDQSSMMIAYVYDNVISSLVPSLFPERVKVWESLQDTDQLFYTFCCCVCFMTNIVKGRKSMLIYI